MKTAGLLTASLGGFSIPLKKGKPKLSFSTLGCPDWTFKTMVEFASSNGYTGLEMRGILSELDLPKCVEFSSRENIRATRKLMYDNGLKFVNLGSSAQLHQPEGIERRKHIDEAKRFIDLAESLSCPYIRVFPNNFPKEQEVDATVALIVNGLRELGDFAKGSHVKVLMETHGDVVRQVDVEKIMREANHPNIGLVWDPLNMWTVTRESPAQVYATLKKYIYHAHIKNAILTGGKITYTLLGDGEVPVFEAIDALRNGGYTGYYSFEWEKRWHPEIASPEIALADYPHAMVKHFAK